MENIVDADKLVYGKKPADQDLGFFFLKKKDSKEQELILGSAALVKR